MENKLTMSWQCILAAEVNSPLVCIRRSVASRLRDPSLLLNPDETRFGVMCPVLGSQTQERYRATEVSQKRAMKTIRRLEYLLYEDTLERRFRVGLHSVREYFDERECIKGS